jgi:hypothetical protein
VKRGLDVQTAIAVTGPDLVLPPSDGYTPAALALLPDEQSLDAALSEVQAHLERHGHLLVLCPHSTPPSLAHRLRMARSMLEDAGLVLLGTAVPPLATAVLAQQLCRLSTYDLSPGVLASSVPLLEHYIYAGAMLNSVSKLDHVPVSLKAHAGSWMPGTQFGVLANPKPELVKVDDEATLPGPEYATHMTVASNQLSSDWVRRKLAIQWPVQALHEAKLPQESARWWGTVKMVEFATAIPDVRILYQLINSVRREQCSGCGMEFIGERCRLCSPSPAVSEKGKRSGSVVRSGTSGAESGTADRSGRGE